MNFKTTLWGIISRWWWLILAGMILSAGVSYVVTSKQAPVYMAKATVGVGLSIRSASPTRDSLDLSRNLAYAYAEFARRRLMTEAVIEALGLPLEPEELSSRIEVNVISSAQLLEIFAYDNNPAQAAAIAEEVARQLVEEQDFRANPAEYQQWAAEMATVQARLKAINEEIDKLRDEMLTMTSASELAEARARLTELENVLLDNQQLALQYAQLLAVNPANTIWWVEHAIQHPSPVAPNKVMNVVLGAVAGTILAAGAVIVLEFFDDTLRWRDVTIDEVEGMPVLGVLAAPSRRDPIAVRYRPRSPEAEAVRQLRARIALSPSPHSIRVVLITSPRPAEGKTLTSANLAVASALGGLRTLLIDADLRNPSLNEYFDAPNVRGLVDLLSAHPDEREALLPQIVREVNPQNLFLLTAGRTQRDPAVLLGSPEMEQLLSMLRDHYDYVVIDTPPTGVAADAATLSGLADGAILVLRMGRSSRRLARKAKERLSAPGGTNVLGVAITGVPSVAYTLPNYRYVTVPEHSRGPWSRIYRRLPFLRRVPLGIRAWETRDGTVLLPIPVVAQRLGVRHATARKWCRTRRLKGVRRLFRWWVPERELEAYLARELSGEGDSATQPEQELLAPVPVDQADEEQAAALPDRLTDGAAPA